MQPAERPLGPARSCSFRCNGRPGYPPAPHLSGASSRPSPFVRTRRPPLGRYQTSSSCRRAQRVFEPRRARRRARPRAPVPRGARAALGVRARLPHVKVRVIVACRSVVVVVVFSTRRRSASSSRGFSSLAAPRGASPFPARIATGDARAARARAPVWVGRSGGSRRRSRAGLAACVWCESSLLSSAVCLSLRCAR